MTRNRTRNLLLVLIIAGVLTTLGGLGLLSADTAGTATAKWRGKGEVDVLLGVETDDERGDVDDLLADADVALANENTGVVDGLGETKLVDAGLETALQEVLDLEGKNVIELHARLVKNTDTHQTANQGVTLEQALGVLLVEGKKLTVGELVGVLAGENLSLLLPPLIKVTYRAARRILDRVSWTRQTSRLFLRPNSPTSFSSESLDSGKHR